MVHVMQINVFLDPIQTMSGEITGMSESHLAYLPRNLVEQVSVVIDYGDCS